MTLHWQVYLPASAVAGMTKRAPHAISTPLGRATVLSNLSQPVPANAAQGARFGPTAAVEGGSLSATAAAERGRTRRERGELRELLERLLAAASTRRHGL